MALRNLIRCRQPVLGCLAVILFSTSMGIGHAQNQLSLETIEFQTLPGNRLEIKFGLSGPAISPRIFQTENPARIAVDFPGVANRLPQASIPVSAGTASRIDTVEAGGRTRSVVNLTRSTQYRTRVRGNNVYLTLGEPGGSAPYEAPRTSLTKYARPSERSLGRGIRNVDFRRGEQGEGRLVVELSDPGVQAAIRQQTGRIILSFPEGSLPSGLARKLDVQDFATPVKTIETTQTTRGITMTIATTTPDFDYLSYQTDSTLTVEVRALSRAELDLKKRQEFQYTGERLSLNFQDIPVRSVLQVIADFNGRNIVASDTVAGNITLRLDNVPWDQALAVILRAKGLAKREEGDVIWVAPAGEINEQERQELEARQTVAELEPLRTEIFELRYARADDIRRVLVSEREERRRLANQFSRGLSNRVEPPEGVGPIDIRLPPGVAPQGQQNTPTLLSQRGTVTIDERTNIVIVKDIARNLESIRELIAKVDVPVRQVLIDSRIVVANSDFSRELGARFAGDNVDDGTLFDLNQPQGDLLRNNGFASDFPAQVLPGAGAFASLQLLRVGGFLLQLELSALQQEGRGEIISSPRVITADRQNALIQQGTEIPFQTVSQNGTQTEFREAVLELDVTPQITPDDSVIMQLRIRNDQPGAVTQDGLAIDTQEVRTNVRVNNGETVVLGGVYITNRLKNVDKVPFFGDLPGIGHVFRHTTIQDNKSELLVFITPKILKESFAAR